MNYDSSLHRFDPTRVLSRIEYFKANPGKWDGIHTGFSYLDRLTRGFKKKRLIVVGARPSIGKTTLALNIALNVALNGGKVAFFSQEMDEDQLLMRVAGMLSGVPSDAIEAGTILMGDREYKLKEEHYIRFSNVLQTVSELNIRVQENAVSLEEMAEVLDLFKGKIDMVIDDHIGLHSDTGMGANTYQAVTRTVKKLKQMSMRYDVPLLALSQLSRAVEMRDPPIPQLSDLKDSGEIEASADVVLLLYRRGYYMSPEDRNKLITDKMEILVAKNRDGGTGVVYLPMVMGTGQLGNNIDELRIEQVTDTDYDAHI